MKILSLAQLILLVTSASFAVPTKESAVHHSGKILWDYWFTVTAENGIHAQYYNERVELKDGRIFFLNRLWKKEEDFVNQEQLGELAVAGPELTPVLFNFHSTYRTTETTIDGTITDGTKLTVKAHSGNKDLPVVQKGIPQGVILSQFFPVWLGYHIEDIEKGKPTHFAAILEDNLDLAFMTQRGTVVAAKDDEFAKKTGGHKLRVTYLDQDTYWWVDEKGAALKIEMPAHSLVIQRASQELAEKFLD